VTVMYQLMKLLNSTRAVLLMGRNACFSKSQFDVHSTINRCNAIANPIVAAVAAVAGAIAAATDGRQP
jgi:hypothetical protein